MSDPDRKRICLITEWYPSPDNPYRGLFFKEQAFAVADRFDFLVVHYREQYSLFPSPKIAVEKVNTEANTIEYSAVARLSVWLFLRSELHDYWLKFRGRGLRNGVGKYVSESKKRFTRRKMDLLFNQILKEEPVDAFYCVDAQLEAWPLQCAAAARNKPYAVSEHAPVPWPGMQISETNIDAIQSASLFFAISRDKIRQLLLQNIRLPRTVYIGNLIDETKLTLPEKREPHEKTLLIVAAHSFYKNYNLFIDVMNRLVSLTPVPFHVLIVGYASNKGYSEGVEAFEARIRSSAFADRAELIPEVPHDSISSVYHRADAFIMTSVQEGQPVSAMEAACCGLPVFSTRCGGVEDYVDDSIGRIYPVDDAEGMARGLCDYVEERISFDPEHIRRAVVDRFGREAFRRTFCAAFSEIIDSSAR